MTKPKKTIFYWLFFSALIVLLILLLQPLEIYVFFKNIALLFPDGIIAVKERDLLFFIQIVMLFFVVPIYLFTFIFSWWYRAGNEKSKYDPHLVDHKVAEFIWWGVPLVMTIIVCIVTVYKTYELDPYKPIESENKPIEIEVVALQWKWLFIYPEEGIATVNYIRIPKNTPVHFIVTADAPMNTLWIPRLSGMIYAMPGMRTQIYMISEKEGQFRGSSAMISGKGFAGMTFITDATSEEDYQDWLRSAKQSGKGLDRAEYRELVKPSENNPVETYRLQEPDLFQLIINQYMKPPEEA